MANWQPMFFASPSSARSRNRAKLEEKWVNISENWLSFEASFSFVFRLMNNGPLLEPLPKESPTSFVVFGANCLSLASLLDYATWYMTRRRRNTLVCCGKTLLTLNMKSKVVHKPHIL
ncbi:Cytochrome b-c1 complex subunit 8 [Daphnia magna]|uniref:Cytochrome b-c1 complex subunit 8 n=1 Tax=Daphnia magna TaxID=35525 RepID=A0A164LLN0_9CRUS|nr:Cytochrome b-c1 complex subunit 8 [Daphnia magna]